ncbi:MAG TPA: alpha/beta hydrolase, partial [Actinomycetota bacterium]|nr:alpha/beta hydrolase [Actinomycetota bacterium]
MYSKPDWIVELEGADPDQLMYPPLPYTVREQLWWVTPPDAPEGWVAEHDLVYGTGGGRDLHVNIYRPAEPSPPRPAVLFVHGGGWMGGDKLMNIRHAGYMSDRGFVGATCEYRFSGEAGWPAALEDVKAAVRW